MHLVIPKSFNDAQDVADKFKDSIPVIINLQGSETDLSKRLIDFASGLTYALDGGMQRIADKVFLLTPRNVEVSAEERARLIEKGFFNQSPESAARTSGAMQVGFIGAGNMARALARGLGRSRAVHGLRLRACAELAAELGGEAVKSNKELAERADLVVLAHKPAQLDAVAREVAGATKAVVSLLARTTQADVRSRLPGRAGVPARAEHAGRGVPWRARVRRARRRAARGPGRGAVGQAMRDADVVRLTSSVLAIRPTNRHWQRSVLLKTSRAMETWQFALPLSLIRIARRLSFAPGSALQHR